jgi:predicted protein tyrosine phosphatase
MRTLKRNHLSIITNPYQSNHIKVLTVCSGGVLRSPTTATLLTQMFNYNCRSCGTEDYALVPISQQLIYWADIIVCAENYHAGVVDIVIDNAYLETEPRPEVYTLNVPDDFDYMDSELQKMIVDKFREWNFK